MNELLRMIPRVDDLLREPAWREIVDIYPEGVAKDTLRAHLDQLRAGIKDGAITAMPAIETIFEGVRTDVARLMSPHLKRVINGTGVIIHTNLGRSLLPDAAIEAMTMAARHYTNLEYDLGKGARGDRYEHCSSILKRLTNAESTLVVNNNAAAVFLILNTLAEGKEVIISRGELIEIGGSFRIPDVMKKSGVILREVGTTNRTYKEDFEHVIYEETALLMKAHTSNFKIKGFAREIETEELVSLGQRHNIPTYLDAGSGLLFPLKEMGIQDEPLIMEELAKGIDIISFSGDKLPGAPQAGIIVGKKIYIDAMKRNPMARAFRSDKFTLAGIESTLLLYLDMEKAKRSIPTLRMIYEDTEILKKRATRIVKILKDKCPGCSVSIARLSSEVGGGTLPDVFIPSFGIALKPESMSAQRLEERLRGLTIPIIGRIEKDNLLLDMRTILKEDEVPLISGIQHALMDGK
ncbi:MAG: L-seryl-tRNA(Sec) selenium transferase [Syntrophus sp. (in: bacteria)]|nr:L-seryl-tRNA(Sec) selenium transferase [Syntrophus sp. (in: bacteria)]